MRTEICIAVSIPTGPALPEESSHRLPRTCCARTPECGLCQLKSVSPQEQPNRKRTCHWYKPSAGVRAQKEQTDRPLFVLHDGPPYANGNLHCGEYTLSPQEQPNRKRTCHWYKPSVVLFQNNFSRRFASAAVDDSDAVEQGQGEAESQRPDRPILLRFAQPPKDLLLHEQAGRAVGPRDAPKRRANMAVLGQH
jgi:hypothetical protein